MPTKIEKDDFSGEPTTGHEWDGIKELNLPLPRWWLWLFWATIVWSLGYWIAYPAWPLVSDYTRGLLGYSSRAELAESLAQAKARQADMMGRVDEAELADIVAEPDLLNFAIAGGRSAFGLHCSQCHGSGAEGARGYPNLNDDDWLWGGDLEAIQATIRYGVRSGHDETRDSAMPAFLADQLLTEAEVGDVAVYVLSLSGEASDQAAAARGASLYAENCAACHGEEGEGSPEFGAPRLNDPIWLYGGSFEDVVEMISFSRAGVMPAWVDRLEPATVKQLAVYVHSLGGGQ